MKDKSKRLMEGADSVTEYWGFNEICQRMNISHSTLYRYLEKRNFPMFRRRMPTTKKRKGITGTTSRDVWYTNERMISLWEMSMAREDRNKYLRERELRREAKIEGELVPFGDGNVDDNQSDVVEDNVNVG